MKRYFKFLPVLFLGFCLFLNSCSKDEDIIDNQSYEFQEKNIKPLVIIPSYEQRINKLDRLGQKVAQVISEQNDANQLVINDDLNDEIINLTEGIYDDMSFTRYDIIDNTGIDGNLLDNFYLYSGLIMGSQHSGATTEADIMDCLGEALGLNALAAFVQASASLYASEVAAGWAVDAAAAQAFRQAGVKAVKKIASRYLGGGIGAAIIIGEFIWCMMD